MKIRRLVEQLIGLVLVCGVIFVAFTFLPHIHLPVEDKRPADADEADRLRWGNAIGKGLVSYARDHDGILPPNLDALVPSYVQAEVPVSEFVFHHPGKKLSDSMGFLGRDNTYERHRNVKRAVVIQANGVAYLLIPGA